MKQFDFEQVGKRLPYNVPDGFFDKLESDVYASLKEDGFTVATSERPKSRKKTLRMALYSVVAVAAAIALFFVVQPLLTKSSTDDFELVELAFNNLSTEDQDYLLHVYEEDDLFMNP